jgi:hypothetical protein
MGSHSLCEKKNSHQRGDYFSFGGEGGIRTHGTIAGTTVFKTVPFDRSGTSPEVVQYK